MTLPAAIHLWTFRLSGSLCWHEYHSKKQIYDPKILAMRPKTGTFSEDENSLSDMLKNGSTERDEKSETLHLPMSITMLTRPDSSLDTML